MKAAVRFLLVIVALFGGGLLTGCGGPQGTNTPTEAEVEQAQQANDAGYKEAGR